MLPVVFKPTISVGEWQQTYALDRAATGIGTEGNALCSKTAQVVLYQDIITKRFHHAEPLSVENKLIHTVFIGGVQAKPLGGHGFNSVNFS